MRNAIFFFVIYFFSLIIQAQEKIILKGQISDKETKANLPGVDIHFSPGNSGAVSDANGKYRIELHPGTYQVSFEYLGYESVTKVVVLKETETLDITLQPSSQKLNEIIISNHSTTESLASPQMSVVAIEPSAVKKVPLVLGEADVVKSLLLLPGISSGGELSTGFNVRGGGTDQNLILLDNATLYNPSHLFGFFSVFNPDAQKSIKLYKGGIPSRFGGRASSVLDIQQRIGNREKLKFGGSIGAISAKALVEGPIKSNKSSFLIAGRSSYAHLFLKLADNDNSAYFYDLNGKLDYELNSKNKLYFSGYFGRDVFNISDKFKTSYGNTAANFRWQHEFQEDFYSNFYLIFSDFQNQITLEPLDFKYDSYIKSLNLIYDFDQEISDKLTLNYGINSKYYYLNPGHLQPTNDKSAIVEHQFTKKYAWQNAIYVEAKQRFSENLSVRYGMRLNSFNRLGQNKINIYENDQPVIYNQTLGIYQEAPVVDSYQKSRKKVLKTFTNLEPRASLSYRFLDNNAIKFSYQRLHQYIQMLVNSNSPTPYNLWVPSGEFLNPLRADQYAIGYFYDFKNENVRFEAEMYFKDFKNNIDYISGADLITNDAVERIVLNGEARAYGLELLLKKSIGKLTGWIAYTLSKSEQKTPGRTAEEPGINNGDWYNSPWDKTHDFSVTANYELSKKWQFNAVFVYQTGQPVTFPVSQYNYEDQNIPNYGRRNSNRLFDFHHLDVSAILTPNPSSKKTNKGQWVFSIYNLYNRKNAASLNFAENEKTGVNEAKRLSIFGIIPSVSYQFNF